MALCALWTRMKWTMNGITRGKRRSSSSNSNKKLFEYIIWPLYIIVKRRHPKTTWIYRVSIENGFFSSSLLVLLVVVVFCSLLLSRQLNLSVWLCLFFVAFWLGWFFIQYNRIQYNIAFIHYFFSFLLFSFQLVNIHNFGHNHVCIMKKALFIYSFLLFFWVTSYKLKMQMVSAARPFSLICAHLCCM